MNVNRQARLGRGLIAALVAIAAAAISHSAAGGEIAGPLPLLLGLAVALLICVPLAAKKLSWVALGVGVGVSQLVFHLLFEFFGHATGSGALPFSAAAHAHAHHGAAVMAEASTGTAVADTLVLHAGHHGAEMWIAHALAAVLTLGMLRGGEAAIWRLIELAIGWVLARMPRPLAPVGSAVRLRTATGTSPHRALAAVLLASIRYRGPPLLAA